VEDDECPDLHERLKCLARIRAYVLTKLNEYIATFTAPQCREICALVQQYLPLELRYMIYSFIHEQPYVTSEDFRNARSNAATPRALKTFTSAIYADQYHHKYVEVVDAKFLGAETIEEFIKSWFGEATFVSSNMTNLSELLDETRRVGISKCLKNLIVRPARSDSLKCLMAFGPDTKINIHLRPSYWRSPLSLKQGAMDLYSECHGTIPDVSKALLILRKLIDNRVIVTFTFESWNADDPTRSFEVKRADLSVSEWAERLTDLNVACGPNERHFLTKVPAGQTVEQDTVHETEKLCS